MKKAIVHFGVILAILWLGVAGDMVSGSSESTVFIASDVEKENIGTGISFPLYGLTEQTPSSVNVSKEISFPSLKNLVGGSLGLVRSTAAVFYTSFSQYAAFLRNFPVPFGKVDIIFPFHYFW